MTDEYNHYMGGVDKLDQLISTYSFTKKSKKWWKKVFFRLLEISVINACILYMKFHPSFASNNRKHKYFRHLLIHEMFSIQEQIRKLKTCYQHQVDLLH